MVARNGDGTDHDTTDHDTTDYDGTGIEGDQDRYTEIWLDSGDVVIYDVDNADAWVQSAAPVALDTMA